MTFKEILKDLESLSPEDRDRAMAFLASLKQQEDPGYREMLARKIDDDTPANWATLEDLNERYGYRKS